MTIASNIYSIIVGSNLGLLFTKVFETQPELVLVFGGSFGSINEIFQEHIGHFHGTLIDGGSNAAL